MKKIVLCLMAALMLSGCTSKPSEKTKPEQMDFTLDGQYYLLPALVSDFTKAGWQFCDEEEVEDEINLEKKQYVGVMYCKGDYEVELAVVNDESQTVGINDATVIGMEFYISYSYKDIPDDFVTVKGINLKSTKEDIVKVWEKYPNFYNEKYGVSYSVDDAEVAIRMYRDNINNVEVYVADIYGYNRFVSATAQKKRAEYDKVDAISVTDGYKIAGDMEYTMGYIKGTIVSEETIYRERSSYIDKIEGYVLEDELGQLVAIYKYYDDLVQLEVGQEYEIWGRLRTDCYTEEINPIVTLDISYANQNGTEIYNYRLID